MGFWQVEGPVAVEGNTDDLFPLMGYVDSFRGLGVPPVESGLIETVAKWGGE